VGNIILFGPPGAGKGTQANNLVSEFNFFKVSTGDMLRNEIEKKSKIGEIIKSKLDQGLFVEDEVINSLIEGILQNKEYFNRLIFDGYPRNLSQVKNLELLIKKCNQKISGVFSLEVKEEDLIKRILGREICTNCGSIFNSFLNPATKKNHNCDSKFLQKRSDDNEETLKNRFSKYIKETLPILNYYQSQNLLYQIDGMRDISVIFEEIRQIMRALEG
tara:strand:- start:529 stop:1182 length:654 start_codon:yes stop_codon:yes gene_type:complete